MSVTIFDLEFLVDGALTDATAAVITIVRTDTSAEIVSAAALTNITVGNYQYSLTDPALDLTYSYTAVFTYGGEDYTLTGTEDGTTTTASTTTTYSEAMAAYIDNADYEEDESVSKAKAFITACRQLLVLLPQKSALDGTNIEHDLKNIADEMQNARNWLAANDTSTSGRTRPRFFDLSGFRD